MNPQNSIQNAMMVLHETMQKESWFVGVTGLDLQNKIVMQVTNRNKALKRLNKRPMHWCGWELVIEETKQKQPLRGGVGNFLLLKAP